MVCRHDPVGLQVFLIPEKAASVKRLDAVLG